MYKVDKVKELFILCFIRFSLQFLIIAIIITYVVSLPQYKGVVPVVEKELPPQPYTYQYGVADDYSKANFQKAESQDGSGNVQGEYTIALPDGRIQHTKYTADPVNGYIADVTYEGTPVYPPEPAGGYGNPKAIVAAPIIKAGRRQEIINDVVKSEINA